MEAASKNTQEQPRRGRPKVVSDEYIAALRKLWTNSQTTRDLQNKRYMARALDLLLEDARFQWLCNPELMRVSAPHCWRPSILAELGRIDDEDDLRAMAESVCRSQLKTKTAVALIRQWRLGREPKRGWLGLVITLEHAVNDYIATHPGDPWDEVERALEGVLEEVREQKGTGGAEAVTSEGGPPR